MYTYTWYRIYKCIVPIAKQGFQPPTCLCPQSGVWIVRLSVFPFTNQDTKLLWERITNRNKSCMNIPAAGAICIFHKHILSMNGVSERGFTSEQRKKVIYRRLKHGKRRNNKEV